MTRLVPRSQAPTLTAPAFGECWLVWELAPSLVVRSRPRPTRLPSGTLVLLLDAVFSKGRVFCVFLGSKAGVWRPCRRGIFQRA